MFVYTVKPGDSLYTISQKFDVSIEMIQLVNGLVETTIVPGQALLISNRIYTVQPGDSFYTISQMSFVTIDRLIETNPEKNPYLLQPGMKIVLPELPEYTASVLSYLYITGAPSDQLLIREFAPFTTYFSFFEYHFNNDGTLSQLDDLEAIEAAWNSGTAPLATITDLAEEGFSSELTSETLNNPIARQNLIDTIFSLVSTRGYAGVNIDFEGILPEDREVFSGFLRELGERLHAAELLLTIALYPKKSEDVPWLLGYDYVAIGSAVDFIFVMAYNWHYMASEPGPVAPINEVRNAIEFTLERMDSSKVILGVPLYGYDWRLPYNPEELGTAISNQNAIDLAMRQGSSINYSKEYESPYFYYVDEQGQNHVVWFEDTRSIAKKFSYVKEYQLLGIGAWQIGLGFPQGPWLLNLFFTIRRGT